jgi:glycosyltransferase involved in cell wall biosynthesis
MSDVFVRPSLAEGFGISFIEAMACGTAVIGTPVGGITDIIEDGKNGLFAPAGDVSGLAERIERVLSRDLLRHQLTAGGLRTVREKFAWGAVLRRMEAIYGRVAWAGV